jgi:cytochrome b pre-mRNA-processing protein 3
MLRFLFPRLTTSAPLGTKLFAAVTRLARAPHWYVEGGVPDTLDGRFAVLATVGALVLVRLERDGADGDALSVAFTERFIAVMEAEHRELGLGDPKLGRTVRKLVGSLGRRIDVWRSTIAADAPWDDAVRDSLYKAAPRPDRLAHSSASLRRFWDRIERLDLADLVQERLV